MRKFEIEAKKLGLHKLTVDASVIAMLLLKRFGYGIVQAHCKTWKGVEFINYLMQKKLDKNTESDI